jgi:hypothetical protein
VNAACPVLLLERFTPSFCRSKTRLTVIRESQSKMRQHASPSSFINPTRDNPARRERAAKKRRAHAPTTRLPAA